MKTKTPFLSHWEDGKGGLMFRAFYFKASLFQALKVSWAYYFRLLEFGALVGVYLSIYLIIKRNIKRLL